MKPKIKEVIVVEGRYDKNALLQVVDATVITTEGFGVFNNKEKVDYLRRLAQKQGVLPPETIKQAYVPDIFGKERRKKKGGKEGKLGVEGMRPAQLLDSLRRSGATILGEESPRESAGITSADLMEKGFIGPNSTQRRAELIKKLQLPQHISTKGLLEALNLLLSREEWEQM